MDANTPLKEGIQWAHELLEMVMADATPELLTGKKSRPQALVVNPGGEGL